MATINQADVSSRVWTAITSITTAGTQYWVSAENPIEFAEGTVAPNFDFTGHPLSPSERLVYRAKTGMTFYARALNGSTTVAVTVE